MAHPQLLTKDFSKKYMHWDILDQARLAFLPCLSFTKAENFYLAGGTGLAIQLGHRDSIDFDFFKEGDISPDEVFERLQEASKSHEMLIIQKEKNTLSVLVDGVIKLSFFGYKHPLLFPAIVTEHILIASLLDIAAMKFAAITSRSLEKDYVDIFYLLKNASLTDLLQTTKQKLPELDKSVVLKALVYFDDVEREHILFREGYVVDFEDVQIFLRSEVTALLKS